MNEVYCPFKYAPEYTYCDCKYPSHPDKEKYNQHLSLEPLEITWRNHLIEINDAENNYE